MSDTTSIRIRTRDLKVIDEIKRKTGITKTRLISDAIIAKYGATP